MLTSSGLRVVFLVLVARHLGPAAFGDVAALLGLIVMGTSVTDGLGHQAAVISSRRAVHALDEECTCSRDAKRRFWLPVIGIAAFGLLASPAVARIFNLHESASAALVGVIIAIALPLDLVRGYLRGRQHWGRTGGSVAAEGAVRLGLLLAGWPVIVDAVGAMACLAAAAAGMLALHVARGEQCGAVGVWSEMRLGLGGGALVALGLTATALQAWEVFAGKWLLQADAAGVFAGASTLGRGVWILHLPVATLALVSLARKVGSHAWRELGYWVGGLLLAGVLATGAIWLFGPSLLSRVFGSEYQVGREVLVPLALSSTFLMSATLLAQGTVVITGRFPWTYGVASLVYAGILLGPPLPAAIAARAAIGGVAVLGLTLIATLYLAESKNQ